MSGIIDSQVIEYENIIVIFILKFTISLPHSVHLTITSNCCILTSDPAGLSK